MKKLGYSFTRYLILLQKVNVVDDSKSWLMIWPNCISARVTGGVGLLLALTSFVPKTLKLARRALGSGAPLVARRIDWIPFKFNHSQNSRICVCYYFTIRIRGRGYTAIIGERFAKIGGCETVARSIYCAILGYSDAGCCGQAGVVNDRKVCGLPETDAALLVRQIHSGMCKFRKDDVNFCN